MAVITLITGAPGSGKSYYIVYRLKQVLETMPELRVRTNLPVKLEEWGALASRIERIETRDWRNSGHEGPWCIEDWRNYLLVLDECHNFICSDRQKSWDDWLGECRHRGVYGVWLLTQSQKKVDRLGDVGLWCEMQKPEEFRSWTTGIPLGVWWQWLSLLRGQRYSLCCCYEYLEEKRRKQPNKIQWLPIVPTIYRLYESYSTPEKGGISGSCREPWQLGFRGVFSFTVMECWLGITWRMLACCGVYLGASVVFNLPGILMAGVKAPPPLKPIASNSSTQHTNTTKPNIQKPSPTAPVIESAATPAESELPAGKRTGRGDLRTWMQNLGKPPGSAKTATADEKKKAPRGKPPLSQRELSFYFTSGSSR